MVSVLACWLPNLKGQVLKGILREKSAYQEPVGTNVEGHCQLTGSTEKCSSAIVFRMDFINIKGIVLLTDFNALNYIYNMWKKKL